MRELTALEETLSQRVAELEKKAKRYDAMLEKMTVYYSLDGNKVWYMSSGPIFCGPKTTPDEAISKWLDETPNA